MVDTKALSSREINKHLAWLEYEINLCLQYDLPTQHLESQRYALCRALDTRDIRVEFPY